MPAVDLAQVRKVFLTFARVARAGEDTVVEFWAEMRLLLRTMPAYRGCSVIAIASIIDTGTRSSPSPADTFHCKW